MSLLQAELANDSINHMVCKATFPHKKDFSRKGSHFTMYRFPIRNYQHITSMVIDLMWVYNLVTKVGPMIGLI